MIVIANGAAYFINLTKPDNWKFLDSNAIDCVLAPASELAILSTYTDVVAITTLGTELWRQPVAIDGVDIRRIENGIIHGEGDTDPPGKWGPFALRIVDGSDAR